jgi:hypothetical protein
MRYRVQAKKRRQRRITRWHSERRITVTGWQCTRLAFIALCTIGSAAMSRAPVHATSAQRGDPSTVLDRSLARMKSLRTVHGEEYLRGGATNLKISADCEGQAPPLRDKKLVPYVFRYHSWARGTIGVSGRRPDRVDDHYVVIRAGSATAAWERSPRTHGVWRPLRRNLAPIDAAYTGQLCLPLFVNSYRFPVRSRWKDTGTLAFRGRRVWRLQMRESTGPGEYLATTIYIDQSSLYWLHFGSLQTVSSGASGLENFDYSRFDARVTILAPH